MSDEMTRTEFKDLIGKNTISSEMNAVFSLLTPENIRNIADEKGIDLEFALHMYHDTGRNKEAFNEAIENFFENYGDKMKTFDKSMELLKQQIEATKKLKKGIFQDYLKEEVPKLKEVL